MLRFLDLENALIFTFLWILCRVTSEFIIQYDFKSLIIIPFFIFLLSIILTGRKLAHYVSLLSKGQKLQDLYELSVANRIAIYLILGFFTVWIVWMVTASVTQMARVVVPIILMSFNMLPRVSNAPYLLLPWIKSLFNLNIIRAAHIRIKLYHNSLYYISLIIFQMSLITLSLMEIISLAPSVRLEQLSSLLDYLSFTPYLMPLIIIVFFPIAFVDKTLGILSLTTTIFYISLIPSLRGFTHFGTDVYATLYPTLALINNVPEVSLFAFTPGKYGYLYWYVLPSNAALMSLISGVNLHFYAIESSLVLIVFPLVIGIISLLKLLINDWKLVNFLSAFLFIINFTFLKQIWWFVSFNFMLTLFFINLFVLILYELRKDRFSLLVVIISTIITSLSHPLGLVLVIASLTTFRAGLFKKILFIYKRYLLMILIFTVLSLLILIVRGQDYVRKILYSLGLEHFFQRNIEFKLSFQGSVLEQLSRTIPFYVSWSIVLALFLYSILKAKKTSIFEKNFKINILKKVVFVAIIIWFGYILSDFVFTRGYLGFDANRPYFLAFTFSSIVVVALFDMIHKRGSSHVSIKCYFRNVKLKTMISTEYCIIMLLLATILTPYTVVSYNQNFTLTHRENLSYLYIDEVKLLRDFLDKREYEDALVLSYPEVLAYTRSFIPVINWHEIKGLPVMFPDSEKYGAFGAAMYWQTYHPIINNCNFSQVKSHAIERKADENVAYVIFLYRLAGSHVNRCREYGEVLIENDAGFILELPLGEKQVITSSVNIHSYK